MRIIQAIYSDSLFFKYDLIGIQLSSWVLKEAFLQDFRTAFFSNHPNSVVLQHQDDFKNLQKANFGKKRLSFVRREEEAKANYKDFWLSLIEVLTNGCFLIFIVDKLLQKIKLKKDRLSLKKSKDFYEEKFEEVKIEKIKNLLFSIPISKAKNALRIFKIAICDHKILTRVLQEEGNLIRDTAFVNKKVEFKERMIQINKKDKENYSFFSDITGYDFWYSSSHRGLFTETFVKTVGVDGIDNLRVLPKFQNLDFFKENLEIFRNDAPLFKAIEAIKAHLRNSDTENIDFILTFFLLFLTKLKDSRLYSGKTRKRIWDELRMIFKIWPKEEKIKKNFFQGKVVRVLNEMGQANGGLNNDDQQLEILGKNKKLIHAKEEKMRRKKEKKLKKMREKRRMRLKMNAKAFLENADLDGIDGDGEEKTKELCGKCFKHIEEEDQEVILGYLNFSNVSKIFFLEFRGC